MFACGACLVGVMLYECRKKENCFSGAQVYEYRLVAGCNEALLEALGTVGDLTVKTHFPRPFFQVVFEDGTTVSGILQDNVMKAVFPENKWQDSRMCWETLLAAILSDCAKKSK